MLLNSSSSQSNSNPGRLVGWLKAHSRARISASSSPARTTAMLQSMLWPARVGATCRQWAMRNRVPMSVMGSKTRSLRSQPHNCLLHQKLYLVVRPHGAGPGLPGEGSFTAGDPNGTNTAWKCHSRKVLSSGLSRPGTELYFFCLPAV